MEKICDNIYSFQAVLPNSPLKSINIYVIKGKERSLVLDTGFNMPETKIAMLKGLEELNIKIEDTDLFVTHLHSDHSGLASMFYDAGSTVYASRIDGKLINEAANGKYWSRMADWLAKYGIKKEEVRLTDNPGYLYRLDHEIEFVYLEHGQSFKIAEYDFEVLLMPGHTPGHIGLYEKEHKILFCADTILDIITPNITFWGFDFGDMLGEYFDTLKKLRELKVDYCLSTHRQRVQNHKERIDEILEHHQERLSEILESLEKNREYTIREIASKITWRIRANSWEEFPPAQKFFSSGETMAHVLHLVENNKLIMIDKESTLYFIKK